MTQLSADQLSLLKPNVVGPSRAHYYDGQGIVGEPGTYYSATGKKVSWGDAAQVPAESTPKGLVGGATQAQAQSAGARNRVAAANSAGIPQANSKLVQTDNVRTTGEVVVGDRQPTTEEAAAAAQASLDQGKAVRVDEETAEAVAAKAQADKDAKIEETRAKAESAKTVDGIMEAFKAPAAMTKAVKQAQAMLDEMGVKYEDGFPAKGKGAQRKNAEFLAKHSDG